jgi:hypothetical protein
MIDWLLLNLHIHNIQLAEGSNSLVEVAQPQIKYPMHWTFSIWTKNSEFEEQFSGTLKQYYTSMEKYVEIVI